MGCSFCFHSIQTPREQWEQGGEGSKHKPSETKEGVPASQQAHPLGLFSYAENGFSKPSRAS
ncbi:hypothetical protein EVA_07548 [gut metagenome]|uniref:Uncharacterized protein n=1 Tax=gut metagenome TaxID=749906 RepID=J9GBW7_9ZZZZ